MKLETIVISIGFGVLLGMTIAAINTKKQPEALPRDYQIDLHIDTIRIYDGERLVGSYITTFDTKLDSILLKDNL